MDYLLKVAALVVTASAIAIHLLTRAKKSCPANLPPGSLGVPVIGQTLGLFRAMRANSVDEWFADRIHRYGLVSKLSLLCSPTVLLAGPAANKFIFFSSVLRLSQPRHVRRIIGERSILALHGEDHRRIRAALSEFLKPDMLKLYVSGMDAEVRRHLADHWAGRTTVTVLPLLKRMTFDVMSSLLGLETGPVRDALADDLARMLQGMAAVPVNLPFTAFGRSLKASRRARRLMEETMREKKAKLKLNHDHKGEDLISRLLSMRDDHGQQLLTDEEIVDNSMAALIAGRDTTAILITFMVRQMANDPATLAAMVQEHQDIASNKASEGEVLTWEDLSKMKFTWRVAQETLRMVPPVFGASRTALEDIDFHGYRIPKGWQVFWTANVTHMDPSTFHEPAKFEPSRFDNHSPAVPPCSFVAFGGGPRICPGIDFAKMETLVTMHNLLRNFRWKLCCKDNTFVRDPMPSPLLGLPIQLEHLRTSL